MKLIDNWKDAWKFASMIAAAAIAGINFVIAQKYFGFTADMTIEQLAGLNTVLVGTVIPILRLIKQFGETGSLDQSQPVTLTPPPTTKE